MKSSHWIAAATLAAGLAPAAHAATPLPIIDGFTSVTLTSATALGGLGLTVGTLGSAIFSPGSDGTPIVYFPITGGQIDTSNFAGTIEHAGSGLSLSAGGTTLNLTNFVIDTTTLTLAGDANAGALSASGVSLFNIGLSGQASAPYTLSLTAAAAGALTTLFGAPDLTGTQIGLASTLPVTAPVPEPATVASMLAGLALLGGVMGRRRRSEPHAATA